VDRERPVTARDRLVALRDAGALGDLDVHLALSLARIAGDDAPELLWAAALASQRTGSGHVCADLAAVAGRPLVEAVPDAPVMPDLDAWSAALRATPVVGGAGDDAPLVLDTAGRLYLRRYWAYEREVADEVRRRAAAAVAVDAAALQGALEVLWPSDATMPEPDWQRVAAVTAVLRRLCIVAGGPGTGKTSTVVRLLALLAAMNGGVPLVVELAAPTGKAAARLEEALRAGRAAVPPALRHAIPERASTLHRLLRLRPDSTRAGVDRERPLRADVVVVDEASMVDLALMAKLLRAVRPDARLLLLGDKDQLASVEAGAVLADLCGDAPGFSPSFAAAVGGATGQAVPAGRAASPGPLRDAIVVLQESRRFRADSGIARLAAAVNRGDGDEACALLTSGAPDLGWRPVVEGRVDRERLAGAAADGFGPYLACVASGAAPAETLRAFDRFRMLCAHREGAAGAAGVNRLVEDALEARGLLRRTTPWFVGRPVMVTRNDHGLRLANGDVGIVLPDPDEPGRTTVAFPAADGGVRRVPPARLPAHETVWAMTVHKSQGSEFDRVVLLLPPEPSRVVTRELLYTAITRARDRVEIWGRDAVVRAGVAARVERSSGLRDALWDGEG
jgi:exodeoxyribonuclease V alpha subunit